MKRMLNVLPFVVLIYSCNSNPVSNPNEDVEVEVDSNSMNISANILDQKHEVADELKLNGGIVISWFEHGDGEHLVTGDVVSIDYKVLLENGDVVDGNHLLKKNNVPFMVGFGMQTRGWDEALKELRVGDFAEIFIPSELARGEKGIEGLIPPNSNNILKIRVLERVKPSREIEGNKVWVFEENSQNEALFNEKNEILFHCMAYSPSTPMFVNTFRENNAFKLKLEDQGLVPGLKKALINAKKSDRMFVYVPSTEAYGGKGFQDVVRPNEPLFYNILVMDIIEK